MKKWLRQFTSEDWIIVFAGAVILALAIAFPTVMPEMPKTLATSGDWLSALYMFLFVLVLTYVTSAALRRPLKGIFLSLLVIFLLTLGAQLIASIPAVKKLGFEPVFLSAISGKNIDKLMKAIEKVRLNNTKRVTTGVLNEIVQNALATTPAPQKNGKRLKIRYITQTGIEPPTFVLFVNDTDLMTDSYRRHIENCIRNSVDFSGTPIRITTKSRGEEDNI